LFASHNIKNNVIPKKPNIHVNNGIFFFLSKIVIIPAIDPINNIIQKYAVENNAKYLPYNPNGLKIAYPSPALYWNK
jgi:hypothetical protein